MVSGTKLYANNRPKRPIAAKIKKVEDSPKESISTGKDKPTQKFVSQRQRTVSPMPIPRRRSGKSSDRSSQVIGERKPCWKKRKLTVRLNTT